MVYYQSTTSFYRQFICILVLLLVHPLQAKIRFPLSDLFTEANNNNNNNNNQQQQQHSSGNTNSISSAASIMASSGGASSSNSMDTPASSSSSSSSIDSTTATNNNNNNNSPHNSITTLADLEDVLTRLWEKYKSDFQSSVLQDVFVKYPKKVVQFVWYNIILYKPPVGIVAAYTITKLITSGRIFRLRKYPHDALHSGGRTRGGDGISNDGGNNDPNMPDATSERALHKASKSRLDRHKGRALDLDQDDMIYKQYGGIERVRRRLAWSALDAIKEEEEISDKKHIMTNLTSIFHPKNQQEEEEKQIDPIQQLILALDKSLKVAFSPGGSHTEHVQELLEPLAEAEQFALDLGLLPPNGNSGGVKQKMDPSMEKLLRISMQTGELHILDSTLRLTRDRLLRTCFRLSRTVKFWKRRVQSHGGGSISNIFAPIIRPFVKGGTEGDRMRLAFAESAYQGELLRLGRILNLLDDRPSGMDDSKLQLAVQKTLQEHSTLLASKKHAKESDPSTTTTTSSSPTFSPMKKQMGEMFSFLPSSWTFPPKNRIANFALRYNVDGRGKFSFQTYDSSVDIGGTAATEILLQDYGDVQQPWLDKAQTWSLKARGLIYDTIQDALETSVQPTTAQEQELTKFQATWKTQQYNPNAPATESILHQWTFVYEMVRDISRLRRVGEGKSLKLKEVNIVHWLQQWDLMGLPSAALKIYLAYLVNQKIEPYFPRFKAIAEESFETVSEIFMTRFWTPFKDLIDELMNRDTNNLMTGVSLDDEANSLDNMLRDLGFGDGTPETRHEAMVKASRQYESDMNTGLIRHALGGRLVRLMLIQVQQLKVGMLDAAGTVDVLYQANRFNMQLLAIIPAIVIVAVGGRLLSRFLFTVRVKDLRPMSSVHAEMTEYLNELESILLLTRRSPEQDRTVPASQVLGDRQLGEFALTLYDYLVLLDYSSPQPFPNWQCDAIHQSVTEFLGRDGSFQRLTLDDQIRLVDLIKRKNQELSKYL